MYSRWLPESCYGIVNRLLGGLGRLLGCSGVCQGVVSSVHFVNENYDKKC